DDRRRTAWASRQRSRRSVKRALRPCDRRVSFARCTDMILGRGRPTNRGQAVAAKTRYQKTVVSASELSQMGACERLVLFEAKYGKRKSHCQREAIERGRREHA